MIEPTQGQTGEVLQPVPQAPLTDSAQPFQGGAQQGDQIISEEQKQGLLDMIDQIRQKLGSFNATKFASSNKGESMRRDLLQQVFQKLQLAGVDLSDPESVNTFIQNLQQTNPELATMFEKSMDILLGGQQGADFSNPQDPTQSMDLSIPPQNMNNENANEQSIQNIPQG
jgi:hypothetical protein